MLVAIYRMIGSPVFGGSCRFTPSCSEYAVSALNNLALWQAIGLIFKRLLKCRPGGPFGYDPVPCVEGCSHDSK